MEIRRDKYLKDLVVRMGNGAIKVVTGIRRCGKTYLVFELFARHLRESGVDGVHIIELALDDESNAAYRDPDELYRYVLDRIGDDGGRLLRAARRGAVRDIGRGAAQQGRAAEALRRA